MHTHASTVYCIQSGFKTFIGNVNAGLCKVLRDGLKKHQLLAY